MVQAYDAGKWDPSGYEPSPGAFKTAPLMRSELADKRILRIY